MIGWLQPGFESRSQDYQTILSLLREILGSAVRKLKPVYTKKDLKKNITYRTYFWTITQTCSPQHILSKAASLK